MVDHSEACAYYMVNATRSGTAQTVNYARNQGCKLFDLLEKQPERFVKTPQQQQISWSEQVIVRESYPTAQENRTQKSNPMPKASGYFSGSTADESSQLLLRQERSRA